MKRHVISLLLVFCTVSISHLLGQSDGQKIANDSNKSKILNKLSISPQLGLLHSWGDFKDDGIMPALLPGSTNNFGFGLYLNYNFKNYLSFSTGIIGGKLEGRNDEIESTWAQNEPRDLGIGILYRTNLFEFTFPRIDLNVTRLIFKDNNTFFNKFSVGILASHGLVFYDSKIYAQGDPDVNLIYASSAPSKKEIRGSTNKTTEAVTSFGSKLSYIINDRFDINLESSIRFVNNDKLDAWEGGDFQDAFSFTAIGATYHLKKRSTITKKFIPEENKLLAEDKETAIEEVEVKEDEIVEADLDEDLTVFGRYKYNELPMSKTALVVLDENGIPIDTIYTEEDGSFTYRKLNIEQEVNIRPLDLNSLSGDDVALYLEDEQGVKTKEFDFSASNEQEVIAGKEDAKPIEPVKKEIKLSDDEGYYVAVAAFRKMPGSRKMARMLEDKGETPIIIRNLRGTWNLITISKHSNKKEALIAMKKARDKGYSNAWVHIILR